MDIPKESVVAEDIDCGIIVQNNVRRGDGAFMLMESFSAPYIGDTLFILIPCG